MTHIPVRWRRFHWTPAAMTWNNHAACFVSFTRVELWSFNYLLSEFSGACFYIYRDCILPGRIKNDQFEFNVIWLRIEQSWWCIQSLSVHPKNDIKNSVERCVFIIPAIYSLQAYCFLYYSHAVCSHGNKKHLAWGSTLSWNHFMIHHRNIVFVDERWKGQLETSKLIN